MINSSDQVRYGMHGECERSDKPFAKLCEDHQTDKEKYAAGYEDLFHVEREEVQSLFEIGIQGGGSLWLWREYFPNAEVVGLDCRPYKEKLPERSKAFQGYQQDGNVLRDIIETRGPFDVVVDDGGHIYEHQIATLKVLGAHTQIYIVEDVGSEDALKFVDYQHKSLVLYKVYESSKTPEKMFVWKRVE